MGGYELARFARPANLPRKPTPVIARALAQPRVSLEAEHQAFTQRWFPEIHAAASPLLSDPTPISPKRSGGPHPASRPPVGDVTRPPQKPPSSAPREYVGPAMPSAGPSVTEIPLGSPPPPMTDDERRARRLGYGIRPAPPPFDIAASRAPGKRDYTRP